MRIAHHRRYTANHTWHVDWAGRELFVKANPHRADALAEYAGHARIKDFYPVPELYRAHRLAHWTVLVYDRWRHFGLDQGLMLDEITRADRTGEMARLDKCLNAVIHHYQGVIGRTVQQTTHGATIQKLFGARAASDGRLDQYYRHNEPWPITDGMRGVRPQDLARLNLIVNDRAHTIDFVDLVARLRVHFAQNNPVWAALTQGDPTDVNIGWSPSRGPVWIDYDTAGLNALPGEFACFLMYQRLHGPRLTPHYNPRAFRDHPSALTTPSFTEPSISAEFTRSSLVIDYQHTPSRARRHVLHRYLEEMVRPLAHHLGVDDLMTWLRPYLVMRLLAVYHLTHLEPRDAALSLALLAQALDPDTELRAFLAITPADAEVN
ncbi:hypothetical protein [Saccharopolyspora endophytica]|uniref:Aminoglycoside phosphotransferase domain-containing protein n=1 Tax=Saccharopolyspora endophytica TaxID=543886 RepID=A0ABS5DQP1_9PSEU|nr:hypothetical protein [Saccharopolyspora endophytica]MBQ0928619.1 hypothetical protein [Saccharopolyspora endophytica]